MINYIERRRKTLSLLFAIFMIIIVIFVGMFGNKLDNINRQLIENEKAQEEKVEKFKALNQTMNETYLNAIESDWTYFIQNHYTEETIEEEEDIVKNFVNTYIRSIKNTSNLIVIAVSKDGEIIYKEYTNEKYENLDLDRLTVSDNLKEIEVENKGEKDNFHYNSKKLSHKDLDIRVYVGFLESVIFDNYIDITNVDNLRNLKAQVESIIFALTILMFFLGALGVTILYLIVQLGRSFKKDEVTKYGTLLMLENYVEGNDEEMDKMLKDRIDSSYRVSVLKLLKDLKKLLFRHH